MRHFENYELEHLLNSTGSIFFRWRCRRHLKHCEICRARMNQLLDDRNFADRFKQSIKQLDRNSGDKQQSSHA